MLAPALRRGAAAAVAVVRSVPLHGEWLGPAAATRRHMASQGAHQRRREAGEGCKAGPSDSSGLISGSYDEGGPGASGAQTPRRRVLGLVNELTKWVVSAIAFAVLLTRRDTAVAWAVLGSIVSTAICKVLKHAINEQRPENARKADPGMPSSHANSLAFLGTYAAAACAGAGIGGPLAPAGIMAAAVFLTWLRVELGYHTTAQVVVGFGLGASTALCWRHLGVVAALRHLADHPAHVRVLWGVTGLAVAWFGLKNVRQWIKERRAQAGPAAAAS